MFYYIVSILKINLQHIDILQCLLIYLFFANFFIKSEFNTLF